MLQAMHAASTSTHQITDSPTRHLLRSVIGRFFGDGDVVDVALAHAGRRDANDAGLALQFRDRAAAAVAHTGAQSANQLIDDGGGAPFVSDAPLDALGHELVRGAAALEVEFILKVTVAAAAEHGAHRPHAAVLLVGAPLEQN